MPRSAVILALAFALSGCSAPVAGTAAQEVLYSASYPAYASISDLRSAADLVIEGTVVSSEAKEIDIAIAPSGSAAGDPKLNPGGQVQPMPMVYTVHAIRVASVIKGKATVGANIEVKEMGGLLKGVTYRTPEGIVLKDEQVYILYLQTYDGSPAALLNPLQAAYPVENGKVAALPGNTLPPSDVTRK